MNLRYSEQSYNSVDLLRNPVKQLPKSDNCIIDLITKPRVDDKLLEAAIEIADSDPKWQALQSRMFEDCCALFAQEVLTGPPQPPYNDKFLIAPHHEAWDELISKYLRICVLAARDSGKCATQDSLILASGGNLISIKDWKGGNLLAYDLQSGDLVETYAPASRVNGKRRCLKITTKTGRTETITLNHPFLKWGGWTQSKYLSVGDRIAVPRRYNIDSGIDYTDAWLLGVLIGDATFTANSLQITKNDVVIRACIKKAVKKYGWGFSEYKGNQCRIIKNGQLISPWAWAKFLGLSGCGAYDKFVPDVVYESSKKSIAEFIAGYLDTNAHITFSNGGVIEFYSVSEKLLRGVQHLLLRLGVVSILRRKNGRYKKANHKSWRLVITGDNIICLTAQVNPRGKRKKELKDLVKKLNKRYVSSGPGVDRFPKEVWELVKHNRYWFEKNGFSRPDKKYSPTRQKLKRIAEAENNGGLLKAVNADILWDEVIKIEDAGIQQTYGIEVPKFHNYVANDLVSHNTFFFNFAYPIWRIRKPRTKGYIFSATQDQAIRILGDIKSELENNEKLNYLVPDSRKRVVWSSTHICCSNGSHIYARGYGTRVRGGHPDWIVVDDGINDESAYSETVRKKAKDYFFSAITNMVVPGGQIIVVGCVTPNTWVVTQEGLKRIGKLNPGNLNPEKYYDIDLNVYGLSGFQKAKKFWVQGEVPTKRVTLEFGYRLEGSYRHPFWVMGKNGSPGWCRADKLKIGDYVAISCGFDVWGSDILIRIPYRNGKYNNNLNLPKMVNEDIAYLIGLWTAEGSYEKTGRIAISNTEPEIRDWLINYKPFDLNFKSNDTPGSEQTIRCSSKNFLEFMQYLGVVLGTAEEKVVPERIMSAPKLIVREFLRGLFDGDGNVWVGSDGQQQVMLASVSETLIRDVQILLLNFGILSSLKKRLPIVPTKRVPNGGRFPVWVLVMTGQEARLYMARIGFRLKRKQTLIKDMRVSVKSKVRGIPNQAEYIELARKEKPRRLREKFLNKPFINISEVVNADRPSRATLGKVVNWFEKYGSNGKGVQSIKDNLVDEKLVWLKVEKIQNLKSMTMDFVIEGDHSFVTNGVISHNTPFHASDLYNDLKKNPEYHFADYPAIKKDGTALWSERYSLDYLRQREREIGSIRFAREFMCKPVADEMSIFPGELFVGYPIECSYYSLGMPKEFWDGLGVQIFMGCDFAMSTSVKADYTVIWVMGIDKMGNRWIIEIIRVRGYSFQKQLSLINQQGKKYSPGLIFLEANQMQRIFGDELIRTTDLPIKQFTTTIEKNSLEKGIPSLRVLLENKKFRIPRGDARSVEMTDIWVNEMKTFTFVDGKIQSVGEHDDTAMGCYICDQAVRHGSFSFSFGDQVESPNYLVGNKGNNGNKGNGDRVADLGVGPEKNLGKPDKEELLRELTKNQLKNVIPNTWNSGY